jgi:hypothetical protein
MKWPDNRPDLRLLEWGKAQQSGAAPKGMKPDFEMGIHCSKPVEEVRKVVVRWDTIEITLLFALSGTVEDPIFVERHQSPCSGS